MIFDAQLVLDHIVEACSRQRIAHANPNAVRQGRSHHLSCRQDVFESLPRITQLEEETCGNAGLLKSLPHDGNLLNTNSFVHGVKNLLAAALRAEPDLPATRLCQ